MPHDNPWFNEVIEAHELIQRWLGSRCATEVAEQLLARFSERYSMVGIAGNVLDYRGLCGFFRASGGVKAGLEIEVFDLRLVSEWLHGAVVQYQEKQTLAGNATLRYSTAVFQRNVQGEIFWQHLHETSTEISPASLGGE